MASIAEQAPVLDAVGRRGVLFCEFERSGMRTVLARASCVSPWHYFPPAYLDDSGCAYTWMVNPSGGLVGGDHVTVEARLHADTHVVMTSPSANRVYRSVSEPSVQEVRLTIGSGARVEWLPEVTIPFAGSRFRQSIRVNLQPGASVVLWDAMASGRIAMGERWAFTSLENEIEIETASGRSVIERCYVTPETAGRFAMAWDYVASLFVIVDGIEQRTLHPLKAAMEELLERRPQAVLGGVSEPAVPGLGVKVVARSAPDLSTVMEALSVLVRRHLWQLPGRCIPTLLTGEMPPSEV